VAYEKWFVWATMAQQWVFFVGKRVRKNGDLVYNLPVYLATPLNVMSSIIVGSERPFAFTANKMMR